MRLWSLHPQYLDTKGLLALWREALLAKHVLEGRTRGYKNHPQLTRFKDNADPLNCINFYLSEVYIEASRRNYKFTKEKINWGFVPVKIKVGKGQIEFEIEHLKNKLKLRDKDKYKHFIKLTVVKPHPLFKIVKGGIEEWEKH